MIATAGVKRCYLGWRGKVLLAAVEQLRLATVIECAAHDKIAKDAVLVGVNATDACDVWL